MDGNDHSGSRSVDVIARDAPHLLAPETGRQRALLEIVELAGEPRVRELARMLYQLEPVESSFWVDPDSKPPAEAKTMRARAALLALAAYPYCHADLTDPGDLETVIGDLLADLLHACDVYVDETAAGRLVDRAQRHHRDETSRETSPEAPGDAS